MSAKSKTPPQAPVLLLGLLLALFLFGGLGLAREGARSIRARAYVLSYTEELSWASDLGRDSGGIERNQAEFAGRDAVVFGVGLSALGAMFLVWAAGLAVSLLGRAGWRAPQNVAKGLAALSLATLGLASLALFPAWHVRLLPFYGAFAVLAAALALPVPAPVRRKAFPAVVIAVIAAGALGLPAFPVFAGLVVFLVAGTHVLLLWPRWTPPRAGSTASAAGRSQAFAGAGGRRSRKSTPPSSE